MTVVRSIALGSARKSVGDLNYYRLRGRQMVRKKATFTPNRTFSSSQLVQQSKMRRAQLFLHQCAFNKIQDLCNVTTNRKYSTTSRVNRAISYFMKAADGVANSTYEQDMTYVQERFIEILLDWSLGDLPLGRLTISGKTSNNPPQLEFTNIHQYVNEWLRIANRYRSKSGQLSFRNVVFVSFWQLSDSQTYQTFVAEPVTLWKLSQSFDDNPIVDCPFTAAQYNNNDCLFSFCFALVDSFDLAGSLAYKRALYCTRSRSCIYYENNITIDADGSMATEEDEPVVS